MCLNGEKAIFDNFMNFLVQSIASYLTLQTKGIILESQILSTYFNLQSNPAKKKKIDYAHPERSYQPVS